MDRRVTSTKKNSDGKTIALCNAGESWSPRTVADVIKDIRSAKKSYYVHEEERRTYVRVVAKTSLQTTPDTSSKNNLDRLPHA